MASNTDFLGRGWAFDSANGVHLTGGKKIAEASGPAKVRQSLLLILSTAPGERIGRPDFGCGIHDLVFSARSSATLGQVRDAVNGAIKRWEPRVDVLNVEVKFDPKDARGLLIFLDYQIQATNSRYNLVYPFYLSA